MKFIALFALIVFSTNALAISAKINCASTNIAQTYSTSSVGLPTALKNASTPYKASLAVINNSSVRICVNTDTVSTTVAPTSGVDEHCVAPQMFAFYDGINVPQAKFNIYIRSDVATCTSGTVDLDVW